jgi:hypothetical protein
MVDTSQYSVEVCLVATVVHARLNARQVLQHMMTVPAKIAEATSTYVRVQSLLVHLYVCVMSLDFKEHTWEFALLPRIEIVTERL